jgi:hypothetical protein
MLETQPPELYNVGQINLLRCELGGLMEKEETYWRQRFCVVWLKGGDQNTRLFHECASQRKKTNTISGMMDLNNVWQTD